MAERGNPLVVLRSAILTQLGAHASSSALTVTSTRPTSWPVSGTYTIITNFGESDEEFVGLDATDARFFTMTFARAPKGDTEPDVTALTNDGLIKEALTEGTLTLNASWGMVSLVPLDAEGIASDNQSYNFYTIAREWHTRIDFTG